MRASGPDFAIHVAQNGYAWWYIDARSDDGAHGLTIIAFVGSVFSPYYKWARRTGTANPEQHCALNVALYGKPGRWAMTERGAATIERSAGAFTIGPSALRWNGDELIIDIHEIAAPLPRRVHGRVTIRPQQLFDTTFTLDENGRHRWRPIAPHARIEVEMDHPRLCWSGDGYLDHNNGDEPLETGFRSWDWSRAHHGADTIIRYEARTRNGSEQDLSLRFASDGQIETIPTAPLISLPSTPVWRIARKTRAPDPGGARVVKTLEDTPFYARTLIETSHDGETMIGFHESLDLDKFARPIVQAMLPFRMPRKAR